MRRTFALRDAVGGDGSSNVDHATAVGHDVLAGVFAGVVVVDGVDDAQVQEQAVQDLEPVERGRVHIFTSANRFFFYFIKQIIPALDFDWLKAVVK